MILKNLDKNSHFENFFSKLTACFGGLTTFEQQIKQIAEIARIPFTEFEIDHLAVRMNDIETAIQWKALLLEGAAVLKESEVNGRPIALFKCHIPLQFSGQAVPIIELPFPKGKQYAQQGWEHIEIIIPFQQDETVDAWVTRVCQRYHLLDNPSLEIKISQPQVSGERLANPTVAIKLGSETFCNQCCLKIHPYGINTIVNSERNV